MSAAELKKKMLAADNAPVATKKPFSQNIQIPADAEAGLPAKTVELSDDYFWLRGAKWPRETVDEPEIIKYLTEENDYCKDFLKLLDGHQNKFFEILKGRIKLTDTTVESKCGGHAYYTRTEEELQYSIDCRRKVDEKTEEILLDRNKLAEGKKFCKILATSVSGNGKLMAYRCDFVGDENYKLVLQNLEPGETQEDRSCLPESEKIEQISTYTFHESPDASTDPDSEKSKPVGLFYSVRNEQLRPTKIYYHKFGTEVKDDVLIFESKNDMYTVGVGRTSDKEYIRVSYSSSTDDETKYINVRESLDLAEKGTPITSDLLKVLVPLKPDIEYSADHANGSWFLKTKEGCTRDHFRVMKKVDSDADFSVLVDEDPKLCLSGYMLTRTYLGLGYMNTETGQPSLFIFENDKSAGADLLATKKKVFFPGVDPEKTSHDAVFSGSSNYDDDLINVAVDTPVEPTVWYTYEYAASSATSPADCRMTLVKAKETPNYEKDLYNTERAYVEYDEDYAAMVHPTAAAEALKKSEITPPIPAFSKHPKIPVTIFYKKDKLKKDGSMPLLLNGYGSYGISEEPVWSNLATLYADLGFVVATAHIRGGGDLGEPWYQSGKFLTKKRTFFDFVKVAEKLATPGEGGAAPGERWTSPGNVAVCGGSAGGMLVGAALNMAPNLLRAVIAHVPFVTVLDTMLDGDLPLTPGEFKEWGNPRKNEAYFDYIRSYCPYENINVKGAKTADGTIKYPSIFATTGLTDYRVGYYEGAKWFAKIRSQIRELKGKGDAKFEEPLVVMETNMAAGHAGASGRFDRLKEVSRDVAFLATEFNLIE